MVPDGTQRMRVAARITVSSTRAQAFNSTGWTRLNFRFFRQQYRRRMSTSELRSGNAYARLARGITCSWRLRGSTRTLSGNAFSLSHRRAWPCTRLRHLRANTTSAGATSVMLPYACTYGTPKGFASPFDVRLPSVGAIPPLLPVNVPAEDARNRTCVRTVMHFALQPVFLWMYMPNMAARCHPRQTSPIVPAVAFGIRRFPTLFQHKLPAVRASADSPPRASPFDIAAWLLMRFAKAVYRIKEFAGTSLPPCLYQNKRGTFCRAADTVDIRADSAAAKPLVQLPLTDNAILLPCLHELAGKLTTPKPVDPLQTLDRAGIFLSSLYRTRAGRARGHFGAANQPACSADSPFPTTRCKRGVS